MAAAICTYLVAYRFYSAWICAKVLVLDETRATPAERFNNGRDFVPTNKWVVFGHHFAAIAGPGPLIGPTLAMQFGYLPGTLWILVGAVLGGCVQDMVIMFCSTRRDGRSLGQMARDELGPDRRLGGDDRHDADHADPDRGARPGDRQRHEAQPLGHRHGGRHDPGGDAGRHLHARHPPGPRAGRLADRHRPAARLRGRAAAGWTTANRCAACSTGSGRTCAWFVIIYGFAAAMLPVWLLLAPRDYLSTFLKLGVVFLLAIAIVVLAPGDEDAAR